jgi:hypothetical protein
MFALYASYRKWFRKEVLAAIGQAAVSGMPCHSRRDERGITDATCVFVICEPLRVTYRDALGCPIEAPLPCPLCSRTLKKRMPASKHKLIVFDVTMT